MGSLLLELIPFALGLAVTPVAIATGILLLSSKRPVANDVAFTAPFVIVYGAIAVVLLVASGVSADPLFDDHDKAVAALLVGGVLLALAVVSAVRHQRRGTPRKAGFLARIETATPATAVGLGAVLAGLNPNVVILLGGLVTIAASDLSVGGQVVGAACLVVASVAGLVGPLLWYLGRPASAERGLARVRTWLARHEHAVNLGVLVVFGLVFTVKGLGGL